MVPTSHAVREPRCAGDGARDDARQGETELATQPAPPRHSLRSEHDERAVTRRQALRIGGIALGGSALVVGGLAAWDAVRDRARPFADVRVRWLGQLTGAADVVDPRAGRLLDGLAPDGLWSDLSLTSRERTIGLRLSYERLRTIARAYATPGSRYERDGGVRDVLLGSLDRLHETRYNARTRSSGNWWDWEIGIPLQLTATSMLLYDDLGTDRLERWMAAVRAHRDPRSSR